MNTEYTLQATKEKIREHPALRKLEKIMVFLLLFTAIKIITI